MDGKGKQIRMLMGRVVVKKESSTSDQFGEESSDDDLGFEQNQMDSCVESDFFMESNKKKRVVVSSGGGGGGGGGGKRVSNVASSGAAAGGGGGGGLRICQAENCPADLTDVKPYHRRHKVCELHAKAQVVLVGGTRQRFCQQCSRFHELSEFDDTKRSCRRRLAGHNERRRKTAADSEGSSRKGNGTHGTRLKDMVYGQVDDRGRIKITIQENATYKQFQIR